MFSIGVTNHPQEIQSFKAMYNKSVSNCHVYPLGWNVSFGMRLEAGMRMTDRLVAGDFGNRGEDEKHAWASLQSRSHGMIVSSYRA